MPKLKNLIITLLDNPRIGASAGKTLAYIWIRDDLKNIKSELGVDLGGGSMLNKKYFKTDKYICVDIDQSELNKGMIASPDATAINSRMQEYMKNNSEKKADLLLCIQTMGANSNFEHDETFEVIKQMYNFLKPGGSMIFNYGTKNMSSIHLENYISEFVNKKFQSIKIKKYGAFHETVEKPMHTVNRLLLANLMKKFSPLRTLFGFKKRKIYFICKNKL